VLDGGGENLLTPGLIDALAVRAKHGCQVRVLTATALRQLEPLIGQQHVAVRLANTPFGPAIFRADDILLLPIPHADPGPPALIQLDRGADDGIFDRLAGHYQTLWDAGEPITSPRQLAEITGPAPAEARRRWPGQPA